MNTQSIYNGLDYTTKEINRNFKIKVNGIVNGKKVNVAVRTKQRFIKITEIEYRYLTPNEYELLQTVPIDYTAGISDSARRTMLGEGWTVDIIAHIFRYIKNTPGNP